MLVGHAGVLCGEVGRANAIQFNGISVVDVCAFGTAAARRAIRESRSEPSPGGLF